MALSTYQINEFKKRARMAGLNDEEIKQAIEKKVSEMSGQTGMLPSASISSIRQNTINTQTRDNSSPINVGGISSSNFTSDFVSSLIQTTGYQNNPKTLEGFAGNVGESLIKNVGDIAMAGINIFNPNLEENTVANIARLGIDAAKLVTGDKSELNRARQVVKFYKKRYGEDLENTLYEDPIGVLLDISTVLGGAGAIAKGVGTAGKISGLTKAGVALEGASVAVDPLIQGSKLVGNTLKYTKVADKVSDAITGIRQSIAEEAARRSLRANPTQMERFQELIGSAENQGDIGQWMTENKIYTKEDVVKQLKTKQKEYNKLVRTDTQINGKVFAKKLRERAKQIEETDISPSAEQLVKKLRDEAKRVEKKKNITDTILTNSKTSQFSKVSKKAMTDPVTDNFNKVYGQVALETLEEIAPGSAKVGKDLQVLREFDDIVSKQRNLGKGSQLVNIFKPAFSGLTGGFILGSGIPGGNIPGAVIGGTTAALATNPFIQRSTAKMLTEGVQIPESIIGATKSLKNNTYNYAKTGRAIESSNNQGGESKTADTTLDNNNSLSLSDTNQLSPLGTAPTNSYEKSIPQLRREAVVGLIAQGIDDPQMQLELLNYDEDGNKIGDFTLSEVLSYQEQKQKTDDVLPSELNPFGKLTKRQVLALAFSQGASKSDIEELEFMYDKLSGDNTTISTENMQIIDGLRSEYFKRTQENGFLEVSQAYQKVLGTSETAAGDLSLIYGYMKMLDPNSVVRETEQSMAQNAGAFGDKVQNAVSQVINGRRLTDKQRNEFRNEATKVYQVYQSRQANIDQFYQGYAMKLGVDPSLIAIGLYQ